MAFCINCGQELAEGAKFCPNCGKAVIDENTTFQRKTMYEGTLHKCPNCGEVLNSFVTNCPTCGHEIRDTQSAVSVRELAMKLEQLEAKRPQKKGMNKFMQASGFAQLEGIDEQKIDLIRNFYIPNTKEDVLEFIVFAAANIDLKAYGLNSGGPDSARRGLSDAWLSKLEQAEQKAEILFGKSQEYVSVRNVYEKKLKEIKKTKYQIVWLFVVDFLIVAASLIFLLTFLTR